MEGLDRGSGPRARADIQGLRGLAVLLVLATHAGVPGTAGGYVGVDVFFVVSGFLISTLLLREADRTGRVSLAGFYARRAKRILPAATVVLVAVAVFAALRLAPSQADATTRDVQWAAVFLANVRFGSTSVDYFATDQAPSAVQHYWSLAVEEQFYLVWPALLLLLLVALRGRRRTWWVAGLVGSAWAASLAWSVVDTTRSPATAYFSSLTRAWEIATGVLLSLAAGRLAALPGWARHLMGAGGLVAIGVAAATFDEATAFPGGLALLPVLGTAAVLAAGCGVPRPVGVAAVLRRRPLTWTGDVSYSLYLWHWPVLTLGAAYVGRGPGGTGLLVGVALLAATATYHLVENPVRHSRVVLGGRRRPLLLWPAALSLVAATSLWSTSYAESALAARQSQVVDLPGVPVGTQALRAPRARGEDALAAVQARIADAVRRADRGAPIPFPLVNLEHLGGDIFLPHWDCEAGWTESTARLCPLGDRTSRTTVVAIGDSFLAQWLPALTDIARRDHLRLVPLVKYGCVPFDVAQQHRGDPTFASCPAFRRWAARQVARLHPDLVLLGFRGLFEDVAAPGRTRAESWSDGVDSTLARLSRLAPLEIVSGISPVSFDPRDCVVAPDSDMRTCTTVEESDEVTANRLTRAVAHRRGVAYADVTRLACSHRRCPAVVDRIVVRHDAAHVTRTWSLEVTDALAQVLHLPRTIAQARAGSRG